MAWRKLCDPTHERWTDTFEQRSLKAGSMFHPNGIEEVVGSIPSGSTKKPQ
jgi:hypothetical protein